MSPSEQTAQDGAHRKVLAPWQDKNTHKWHDRGICGASNYLLDRAKSAFMKRQSAVWFVWGLCGEVWCLQRLFCFSFYWPAANMPLLQPFVWDLEPRGEGRCSGRRLRRGAGAKSSRVCGPWIPLCLSWLQQPQPPDSPRAMALLQHKYNCLT